MINKLQVTFRGIDSTSFAQAEIESRAEKFEKFFQQIQSVKVTVECPHNHHNKGKIYHVQIVIHVPGKDIVIGKGKEENHEHEDLMVAIRDACDTADRQLQEYSRKLKGNIKTHDSENQQLRGKVAKIFHGEGFGFIDCDGREVYFNENSVLNDHFSALSIGAEVRFVEEMGEKGPQASTVYY